MNQFFIDFSAINKENIILTGDEAKHITNVLRLRIGEEVQCVNPADMMTYTCEIESMDKNAVVCRITDIQRESTELPVRIVLYQGLPKGDKFEYIIQKAVEMGVYEIVPVQMKRSVVKIDSKKEENKLKRWNAIAKSAAEQSKRKMIPEVKPVARFEDAIQASKSRMDSIIVPYEMAEGMEGTRKILDELVRDVDQKWNLHVEGYVANPEYYIGVFIGPEGGFADSEIELAKESYAKIITLGKRILRTETAPIAILAWLTYLFEN